MGEARRKKLARDASRIKYKQLLYNWFVLITCPFWVQIYMMIEVVKCGKFKEVFLRGGYLD